MARRRNENAATIRERLTAASARLREVDSPHLADAVDEVLAPGAWGLIRKAEQVENPEKAGDPNLPISMPNFLRDEIKELAAAAGANLTADVVEGLNAYVAGTFTPVDLPRATRGNATGTANLNVRIPRALREQVEAKDDDGPSPALVGRDWLMRKYKVGPYAPKPTWPVQ
ncbi:hypothetical protein ABZ826_23705 [Streptomyces sp. NPDC047515]|uniref:hypothetical protein n=1 Tax=Streptomyces sp. NPDC047515 TaxID=3155380 RepID=UPI0033D8B07D